MHTPTASILALLTFTVAGLAARPAPPPPVAGPDLVFEERDGLAAVEAEHFFKQELVETRAWHIIHAGAVPSYPGDHDDPPHVLGASGGACLEILPDTRATHGHKLVPGENFTNEPGRMAVVSYKVHFNNPGRYHVWCRIFSTGPEDNGVHVGLNGEWPESGRRWQTIKKHAWQWDSRQRTEAVHVGVPGQLFLDVPSAGEHTIHFAMREDGFELDKFILARDPAYVPEGMGPAPRVKAGRLPPAFPVPAGYTEAPSQPAPASAPTGTGKTFPAHWGEPPPIQTRDLRPLPGGYGEGGGTLARWIQGKLDADAAAAAAGGHSLLAKDFPLEGTGYYLDRDKWYAIDPNHHKTAITGVTVPVGNGRHHVTLFAVGENDGGATYTVSIGGRTLPTFTCPMSVHSFEEGPAFTHTWRDVEISEGEKLEVRATIGSADGREWSRARWSKVVLTPVARDPARLAALIAGTVSVADVGPPAAGATPATAPKPPATPGLFGPRAAPGDGTVRVSGELKTWHKVTLDLAGPFANERDTAPNPFTDHRFHIVFTHESGAPVYGVPGYFAADGDAGETSATAGTVWRAHFAPDRTGTWTYRVHFISGRHAALEPAAGTALEPFDGRSGSFAVAASDKTGRDFRAKGRLQYVGGHHLRHAGSGGFFLKAGPDSPETLLAYSDFDDTVALKPNVPLKTWAPHAGDWRRGDPTWKGDRGRELIGALNHLAVKGLNTVSFLPYNAGGDGDNVWPFVERDAKLHYDCSKLDQWGVVFDHAQRLGLHLHFKLQETEIDDERVGPTRTPKSIPEALDGGLLGPERRLYLRELVARFGHALALNWNLGEENTQTYEEQRDMAAHLALLDPYGHPVVIHTYPGQQDEIYDRLLGAGSVLTGASLQNPWSQVHQRTLHWVRASAAAGRPWVVANDEQNPARLGVPPDPGYKGFSGTTEPDTQGPGYDLHDIRKSTLWGNLMAGGAGVEYYFGYRLAENDLVCEDFRSRDRSWDYCRIALEFFEREKIPFWRMRTDNALVGNPQDDNSRYCFAAPGELYLVYLPEGGAAELDLAAERGAFTVSWFNPREGGRLAGGSVRRVSGGGRVSLGAPPSDPGEDWLAVVRR